MTGPEHYREAERLNVYATEVRTALAQVPGNTEAQARGKQLAAMALLDVMAEAQYHATMAQTAAIVELAPREAWNRGLRMDWSRIVEGGES